MQNLRFRQVAALAAAFTCLAFTTGALAADAPAALDKAPQSAAMRNSVITVDSLIASENQLALARSKEQSIAAGLSQPEARVVAPSGPPAGQLNVGSIFGFEGDLRANVTFNGEVYENLRVGSRLGTCGVVAIKPAVVVLRPSRRGGVASVCPSAKWTGLPSIPTAAQLERVKATVLGMPSPAIPTPFSSAGAPAPVQSAPRGPAALKVYQPTLQLIPSGPVAPGQTAIPLVPRQLEPVQDERLQQPANSN